MSAAIRSPIGWAILLIVLVLACASVFTVVPETKQAIIVRMGVPQAVVNRFHPGETFGDTGAGLIARVPLLDQVVMIEKREQVLDLTGQTVTSSDGQSLSIDAYARFRVVDPTRAYLAARGDPRRIGDALRPAFGAALREQLGALPADALLAPERLPAMPAIADALDRLARTYGARVTEIRIDRVGLPDGAPLDTALGRMRSTLQQQATSIRDDGYRQAVAIRAAGSADVAKTQQASFGQDPAFYEFYRSMVSYRQNFAPDKQTDGSTQIVIGSDNRYLRHFHGDRKP